MPGAYVVKCTPHAGMGMVALIKLATRLHKPRGHQDGQGSEHGAQAARRRSRTTRPVTKLVAGGAGNVRQPATEKLMIKQVSLAVVAGLFAVGAAHAHATLEQNQGISGKAYKAVVRSGHGCEGKPTIKVRGRYPRVSSRRNRCRNPAGAKRRSSRRMKRATIFTESP